MKKLLFGSFALFMFINLSIAQKNEVIYSNSKLRTGDNVGVV